MTAGSERRTFAVARLAVLACALAGGACTTSSVEEVAEAPGRSGQPADTGAYPNLNVPAHAATTQLSAEETKAKLAQLTALQRRQNPDGAGSSEPSDAARKRLKVSQDEQEQTLKVIEGE